MFREDLLLNVCENETRFAYLRDGKLHDLKIDRVNNRNIIGNIYRGEVINFLSNIRSAFVKIGDNVNGFVHMSDIFENTKRFEEVFDMDFESEDHEENDNEKFLEVGSTVLVQVIKEAIGSKVARLTSKLSLPGMIRCGRLRW